MHSPFLDSTLRYSPFLRPNSANDADMYTDGFVNLVAGAGLEAFSVGAVARECGLSPQALLKRAGGRDRFLNLVTSCLTGRYESWVSPFSSPLHTALPATADEQDGVRAWLALQELARSEWCCGRRIPAEIIGTARAREAEVLGWKFDHLWGRPATPTELAAYIALGDGVRAAMVRPIDPLTFEIGTAILTGWLSTPNPAGTDSERPDSEQQDSES